MPNANHNNELMQPPFHSALGTVNESQPMHRVCATFENHSTGSKLV
jgi:hypothetical protein